MENFIFSKQLNISEHYDLPFQVRKNISVEDAGTDVVICSSRFSIPQSNASGKKSLLVNGEVHIGLFFCLSQRNQMYRKINMVHPFFADITIPADVSEEQPVRIDTKILDVTNVVLMPRRIYTSVTMVISYLAQ